MRPAAIARAPLGRGSCRAFLLAVVLPLAGHALAAAAQGSADPRGTLPLTLEESLARATERSEEVQLARATVDAARQQVVVARSAAFPQLQGNVQYSRTLESIYDDILAGDGGGLGALPFGREHSYTASIGVSQLLFAGGRVAAAVASARNTQAAAELGLREQTAEIALQVRTAYYRALLASELEAIAVASLDQARSFLEEEQRRSRAGYASELDVLRAEVSYENLNPQLVDARNASQIALLNLKRLVNVPLEQDVRLATALEPPPPESDEQRLSREELLDRRASVRSAERQVASREQDVRAARAEHFPSLSFQMSYGRQAFPTDAFDFSGVDWQPDWTAGVGVTVPLFAGFRTGAQVAQARVRLREAQLQLTQLGENVQLEYEQALGERERARATIVARRRTIDQAQRVYDLTVLRYGQGQATQLEISDARLDLLEARTNLAQALGDFYIADASVLRATSEARASDSEGEAEGGSR
jgi:outer membrane protein TolC